MFSYYLFYGFFVFLFIDVLIGWICASITAAILIKKMAADGGNILASILKNLPEKIMADDALAEKLTNPEMLLRVKPIIEEHINRFLTVKLQEKLPVIAMFASPDMIGKIKEGMLEEIDLLLPLVLRQYLSGAGNTENAALFLQQCVAKIPADKLQQILKKSLKKELNYLRAFGASLGFLIGLFHQLLLVAYNN